MVKKYKITAMILAGCLCVSALFPETVLAGEDTFTEEAKEEVYKKFNSALTKNGVLFIGSTEQIMNYKELGFERAKSFFFVKNVL